MSCGDPPLIIFGEIVYKSFNSCNSIVGSVARFECEQGYQPFPSNGQVVCRADGRWSELNPRCVPIEQTGCGPYPTISNAVAAPTEDRPGVAGDRVTYICQPHYVFENEQDTSAFCDGTQWRVTARCVGKLP